MLLYAYAGDEFTLDHAGKFNDYVSHIHFVDL